MDSFAISFKTSLNIYVIFSRPFTTCRACEYEIYSCNYGTIEFGLASVISGTRPHFPLFLLEDSCVILSEYVMRINYSLFLE